MRGNAHVRFGGAGRGNGCSEKDHTAPRPDPYLTLPGGLAVARIGAMVSLSLEPADGKVQTPAGGSGRHQYGVRLARRPAHDWLTNRWAPAPIFIARGSPSRVSSRGGPRGRSALTRLARSSCAPAAAASTECALDEGVSHRALGCGKVYRLTHRSGGVERVRARLRAGKLRAPLHGL